MKRRNPRSGPELDVLLEAGRVIQHVPEVVRARSLSRARATMAVMAALPRESTPAARWRGLTVALAASLALAVGAAVATAALRGRAPSPPAPPAIRDPEQSIHHAALDVPPSSPVATPQSTLTAKTQRTGHPAAALESYAAELNLLARAQVAYAAREFANALALVAEHGRRFPNGRLAEEREGLRVRSLAGAGRTEEARRAAAAFAGRFPRSILLPRLSEEPK